MAYLPIITSHLLQPPGWVLGMTQELCIMSISNDNQGLFPEPSTDSAHPLSEIVAGIPARLFRHSNLPIQGCQSSKLWDRGSGAPRFQLLSSRDPNRLPCSSGQETCGWCQGRRNQRRRGPHSPLYAALPKQSSRNAIIRRSELSGSIHLAAQISPCCAGVWLCQLTCAK
jgi:hypothetical protein